MAIKKGRATDAVARLFSVTAADQAHEAYEAHEVRREHPVPETYEAHEAHEVRREHPVPETYEAHEAHEAPRMPDAQEAYEAHEDKREPRVPETHEAYEAHEAYEDRAPKADGAYRAADTQGKRGKKALRMTMAFSEENMDYIRTMGKLESGGATAYVNRLIEADRRKHADVYRQMKTLRPDA